MPITHKEVIKYVPSIEKNKLNLLFMKCSEIANQIDDILRHGDQDQDSEIFISEAVIEKMNQSIKEMKNYAKDVVSFSAIKYLQRYEQA